MNTDTRARKHHRRYDPATRQLTGRFIQAIEDERKHVARELHDDIGQRLSLVSIQLDSLIRRAAESSAFEADLGDLQREVNTLIEDVHGLAHSLHSSKLEHLGLDEALRELCTKVSQRQGLQVELQLESMPRDLNPDVSLCFYRVAQEGLSNIVKHSGSSRALVTVGRAREALKMQIIDEGIGFEPKALSSGLGLATMEERLRAISGSFVINSTRGFGVTITAIAPVRCSGSKEPAM